MFAELAALGTLAAGVGSLVGATKSTPGLPGVSRGQLHDQFDYWKQQQGVLDVQQKNYQNWYSEHYENTAFQRSVADAKAAGLHPLFALGNSPNFTPTLVPQASAVDGGGAPAVPGKGPDIGKIGDAVAKLANAGNERESAKIRQEMERLGLREAHAQARLAEKQVDFVTEQIRASEFQRTKDALNYSQGSNAFEQMAVPVGQVPKDRVRPVASNELSRSSRNSSYDAASNPAWTKKEVAPGVMMPWPAGADPEEVFPWILGGTKWSMEGWHEFGRRLYRFLNENKGRKYPRTGGGF